VLGGRAVTGAQAYTGRPNLVALPTPVERAHDLPPKWDGRKVEWQGWTNHPSTARLHFKAEVCDRCGSDKEQALNLGVVHPLPGDEMTTLRRVKSKRTGREYDRQVTVPAHPVFRVTAFRCVDCGHDQVCDHGTGEQKWDEAEWWDLDETDYSDDGSNDPRLF
jgi:hypothetical protein